jgi:hypothetical protein
MSNRTNMLVLLGVALGVAAVASVRREPPPPELAVRAHRLADAGDDPAWRLVGAARALLERGDAAAVRSLAAQEGDPAARSAMRLLRDLGLPTTPAPEAPPA